MSKQRECYVREGRPNKIPTTEKYTNVRKVKIHTDNCKRAVCVQQVWLEPLFEESQGEKETEEKTNIQNKSKS